MKFKHIYSAPGLPKLNNGHYGHWAAAAGERKKWRTFFYRLGLSKRPLSPLKRVRLTCIRYAYGKSPDFDNLVISFKSCIDGLKDAGIILDDGPDVILERVYRHEKAAAKKGNVSIEVEEL